MYLYMSYGMPVLAGLFAEGKTWNTYGGFRLGGLSKLFAVIVTLGVVGIIIGGHAFVPSIAAVPADAAANPAGGDAAAPAATANGAGATKQPAAPAPASPVSAPAPKAVKSAVKAGSYGIQLGAFKSSADVANKRWARLDKEYPKLLAGLSPTVTPKKTASGTLYRLQVTGLAEKHARAICNSLKAKSQACVIIHPAQH